MALQTKLGLARLGEIAIGGVPQPLAQRLIAGSMATGTTYGLAIPPEQLGMLHRERTGRQNFVPPIRAKHKTQSAQCRQHAANNKSSSPRPEGSQRCALIDMTTLAIGRRTLFASPASQRRTIAPPAFAIKHRMASGRRRTSTASTGPHRAWRSFDRQATNPWLVGPLISISPTWLQWLSHVIFSPARLHKPRSDASSGAALLLCSKKAK